MKLLEWPEHNRKHACLPCLLGKLLQGILAMIILAVGAASISNGVIFNSDELASKALSQSRQYPGSRPSSMVVASQSHFLTICPCSITPIEAPRSILKQASKERVNSPILSITVILVKEESWGLNRRPFEQRHQTRNPNEGTGQDNASAEEHTKEGRNFPKVTS